MPSADTAPTLTKRKRSSPISYSEPLAQRILLRISQGESLTAICSARGYPDRVTFWNWCDAVPGLNNRYAQARARQAESWADEINRIADDTSGDEITEEKDGRTVTRVNHENINRSRLRVDTRKWLMSKLHPRQFGERIDGSMTLEAGDSLAQLMGEIRAGASVSVSATPVQDSSSSSVSPPALQG